MERRGEDEVKGHTEVLVRAMGWQVVAFPEMANLNRGANGGGAEGCSGQAPTMRRMRARSSQKE